MKTILLIKQIKPWVKIACVNFILLLLGIEFVSFAFIWLTEKQVIYSKERSLKSHQYHPSLTHLSHESSREESIIVRFHPYFGYVLKPGVYSHKASGLKVNNYGFFSPYDYPYIKTHKNQALIGIFGGSVASDFSVNETIDPSHSRTLTQKLKALPQFKNKEIIVLNFANGGYKQPQQLLILSYFLSKGQEFDLVINIDGFNEIALSALNNQAKLEITMPSFQHFQPLKNLVNIDLSVIVLMGEIIKLRKSISQVNKQLNQCYLAACYALNQIRLKSLLKTYYQQIENLEKDQIIKQVIDNPSEESLISLPQQSQALEDDIAVRQALNNWFESSLMMSHLLSMRQIPYFHFIQPNQHYPTQRIFSSEEKRMIRESPYRQAAQNGYPILISKVEQMQNDALNLFNSVKILDQTPETVYRDSCCHYNQLGQNIFTDSVAQSIIETLNSANHSN